MEKYYNEKALQNILKENGDFIDFQADIEPGYYKCIVWFFGQPAIENLYCDGTNFLSYTSLGITTEKVSHYITIQPERSKREDSQKCEMRCSEHCGQHSEG